MKRKYLGRLHDRLVLWLSRRMARAATQALKAGDKDAARAIFAKRALAGDLLTADWQAEQLERLRR